MIEAFIQWHPIRSFQVMGPYDDIERMWATCILCDVPKHGCDHHDAANRIEICMKARLFLLLGSSLNTPLKVLNSDIMSKMAEAMVTELTVRASSNVINQFMKALIVL